MRLSLGLTAALFVFGFAVVSPCRAQGFLDWRWSFDQAEFVIGPSDSIVLSATIFVRPEAPAPLTGRAVVGFYGSLFASYNFRCGFCRDVRFANVNIPPGESMRFSFGTLTPKAPLAPGMYRSFPDEPLIDFIEVGTRRVADAPLRIHVVPEPSTMSFCFLGLALFGIRCFAGGMQR